MGSSAQAGRRPMWRCTPAGVMTAADAPADFTPGSAVAAISPLFLKPRLRTEFCVFLDRAIDTDYRACVWACGPTHRPTARVRLRAARHHARWRTRCRSRRSRRRSSRRSTRATAPQTSSRGSAATWTRPDGPSSPSPRRRPPPPLNGVSPSRRRAATGQFDRFTYVRLEPLSNFVVGEGRAPSRTARERHRAVAGEVRSNAVPRAPGLGVVADCALDLDHRSPSEPLSRARRRGLLD